jgi:hypothetical protein
MVIFSLYARKKYTNEFTTERSLQTKVKQANWSFHGDDYEEYFLLVCDAL